MHTQLLEVTIVLRTYKLYITVLLTDCPNASFTLKFDETYTDTIFWKLSYTQVHAQNNGFNAGALSAAQLSLQPPEHSLILNYPNYPTHQQ